MCLTGCLLKLLCGAAEGVEELNAVESMPKTESTNKEVASDSIAQRHELIFF